MAHAAYRKTRMLTPSARGYIAGLIDGEGTIALTRKNTGRSRYLGISISNNERPMLEWAQKAK